MSPSMVWIQMIQDRNEQGNFVNTEMKVVSIKVGNLFTAMDHAVLRTVQLFNNTLLVTNWILLHT